MKRKGIKGLCWAFGVLSICVVLLGGCGKTNKKTEIVWYISDPYYYDVEEATPYEVLKSERFDFFNERLEELGIPAKVVFKYQPGIYEVTDTKEEEKESQYKRGLNFAKNEIKNLLDKDPEADIACFQPLEYQSYLTLDEYLEKEENEKVKQAIPESIWQVNCINGKTYQIPKGNVSVNETVYCFYKPFLEQYKVELDTENVKQMTPKEVIELLLPYFEQEKILDNKYYLTSAMNLKYKYFFISEQTPVISGSYDQNIVLQLKDQKVVNLLETEEMQEGLKVQQWIHENEMDGQERSSQARPVFQITSIPTIKELSQESTSEWLEVPLGNRIVTTSRGNGVIKDSGEKEMAVQVLAASMYDEELSNLMIYGVPEKDYKLQDGYVVKEGGIFSSMGSFSQIGNNRIAYPNEAEIKEKKEKTEAILQNAALIPYTGFVAVWEDDIWEKMMNIAQIYQDMTFIFGVEDISNLDTYIEEQKAKLKEAGVEEVIADLQRQVDNWKE